MKHNSIQKNIKSKKTKIKTKIKIKTKTKNIGGNTKKIRPSKKHKEIIHPKSYSQYLRLGKTEHPKLINTDFLIQKNPDIQEISKTLLSNTIKSSTYSLLPYYFTPDSPVETHDDYLSNYNSGNCVFFAKKLKNELKKQGIHGYLIPATTLSHLIQPGFPELCHCVVLVRIPKHFIIYEPAFYILEPIIVPIDGTPVQYMINVYNLFWRYQYDSNTNRIIVLDNNGHEKLYYSLMEVQNPSTSISYPVNIHNRRIPIVKYNCDKNSKEAHLSIRLDTMCLEGYCLNFNEKNDGWFPRLDYKPILESPITDDERKQRLSAWIGLSENQCKTLQCNRDELIEKILVIIKHHHFSNK